MADAFNFQIIQSSANAFSAAKLAGMGGQAKSRLRHHLKRRGEVLWQVKPFIPGNAKAAHPTARGSGHRFRADHSLFRSVMTNGDRDESRDDPVFFLGSGGAFFDCRQIFSPFAEIIAKTGRRQKNLGIDHAMVGAFGQNSLGQGAIVIRSGENG